MALQMQLSILPPGVEAISPQLALAREDGCVVLCNAGGPIFSFRENDAEARRLAVAVVTQPGVKLATPKALADALGIDRSMVFEYRRCYEEEGAAALRTRRTGPKGPHKLPSSGSLRPSIGDHHTDADYSAEMPYSICGMWVLTPGE